MPSATLHSVRPARRRPWWRKGLRALWALLQAGIVVFALLLLALRYVALPQLERNVGEVTRLLSQQIGQPVEVGSLNTGWDGWNPRADIRDFRILNPENGSATVTLPRVHLVVAWTSLVALDLRLKELVVDGLQLSLKRDGNGMLHVAGITIDPLAPTVDRRLVRWVMRQPKVIIHNAELAWRDEHASSSELRLTQVELRLENQFDHHRFGLTGAPPPEIAAPVDLRGDFRGTTFADARALTGRVYARLDYADIAAWREWLPLSVPIRSGKGAVRIWLDVEQGELRDLVADVVLANVDARLAPDLPELVLAELEGRLGWNDDGKQRVFYTTQLGFTERGGVRFEPTDFKLTMGPGTDGVDSGRIEFARLELAPLRLLAVALPLPAKWREDLVRIGPTGTLEQVDMQWQGDPGSLSSFSGSGRFIGLGFAGDGALPGVTGLSGSYDASPRGGTLKVDSRVLTIDAPRALAEKLAFDAFGAQVRWRREQSALNVDVDQLSFSNRDLSGTAKGSYQESPDTRPRVDLVAQVGRAEASSLHRYLPLAVGDDARQWMRRALTGGVASNLRVKLAGALAEFPFADAKGGQFQVQAKGQGLTVDYAPGWPAARDGDVDVRVDGARLAVDVSQGRIFGASLGRTRIEIADLRLAHPVLRLDGSVSGQSRDFVRYIRESPLDAVLDHPLPGIAIDGGGALALKFDLPLGKPELVRVNGDYTVTDGRIELADGTPPLDQLSGKMLFTEREFSAPNMTGELLGGPARFAVGSTDGRLHVDGQGSVNLASLHAAYPKIASLTRLSGTTDWKVAVSAQPTGTTWVLDSTLKGAVIDLPAPAGKGAADAVALRIERRVSEPERDVLTADYGKLARLTVERRLSPAGATAERALLSLGGGAAKPDRRGLWIRGNVDAIDADAWLQVREKFDAGTAGDGLPLGGLDVVVGAFSVFGRVLKDIHFSAARAGPDWLVDLNGPELRGTVRWQAAASGRPNGRLVARLQEVVVAGNVAVPGAPAAPKVEAIPAANPWPALDIVADSFTVRNHHLGKLEMQAHPHEGDWQIENLKLTNDDATLAATGWWRNSRAMQKTDLAVDLSVHDAEKFLARLGVAGGPRRAPTQLRGQLAWAGSPLDFNYPTLNGSFALDTGPGQFVQLDPGIGKLLGVLSLQAIRRRLDGDYQDLFGQGFAFDEITGKVRIKDGVLHTDDLKIGGPAARVAIAGEADIARETQNLSVRVQPTLSGSVSLGAAALLLANPLIGAAIGAGTYLAQAIMQDPIEQIFAQRYVVTGSWSDPHVETGSVPATGSSASGR